MSTEKNYLDMPDDEIMGMSAPAETAPAAAVVDHDETSTQAPATPAAATDTETEAGDGADDQQADGEAGGAGGEGGDVPGTGEGGEAQAGVADDKSTIPAGTDGEGKPVEEGKPADKAATSAPADGSAPKAPAKKFSEYTLEEKAAAFDKMTAPFKANGKEVRLDTIEEHDRLKQMGANYTKKMQAVQPHLRVIKMLENNGLLDENKLTHLIDVSKGNTLAIQKLLNDSQFDPMAVDKDKAADYKPGNHHVSDVELQFDQALDDVVETSTGPELISEVHGKWDPESKEVLFQNPGLLRELNQQKETGLYKLITDEVDRQTVLGQIPAGTPFLQAYKAMGDMLHAQGRLVPPGAQNVDQEPAQPVETRVATPPPVVANGDKAAAAASTKASGTSTAKPTEDWLNQSDEDFIKQMRGRV